MTLEQARRERGIRYANVRILDTLLGGKSGKIIRSDCLLCDHLLFLSSKLCVRAGNPGVEVSEVMEELPERMKNEKMEQLTMELIKHKTGVYRKYLRQ